LSFRPHPLAPLDAARAALRRAVVAALCTALLAAPAPSRAFDAERMLAAAGRMSPHALANARALRQLLVAASELEAPGQLQAVNEFFNRRIAFKDDLEVWGQIDYWASPLESLDKGAGDCEDYAIAKYFGLLALGVPQHKLRLVYVRAQLGGEGGPTQAHMVLAYYAAPASDPLILDNLVGTLRPASRRPDLQPVFSFNGEGLWEGMAGRSAGDPTARLARWPAVLVKARAEGFLP
jgi:predicted transglutaminase-like cysteine proteinase